MTIFYIALTSVLASVAFFYVAIASVRVEDLKREQDAFKVKERMDASHIKKLSASVRRLQDQRRDLNDSLAGVNRAAKDRLDGLPKATLLGLDTAGSAVRKTVLTHDMIEHAPTGLRVKALNDRIVIYRNGRPVQSFTAAVPLHDLRAALAVDSVGG